MMKNNLYSISNSFIECHDEKVLYSFLSLSHEMPRVILLKKSFGGKIAREFITNLPIEVLYDHVSPRLGPIPLFICKSSLYNGRIQRATEEDILEYENVDLDEFSRQFREFYNSSLVQLQLYNQRLTDRKNLDIEQNNKAKRLVRKMSEYSEKLKSK